MVVATLSGVVLTWLLLGGSAHEASLRIGQVRSVLAGTEPSRLWAAAALYLLSVMLRAVRWSLVAHRSETGALRLLPVTSVHVGLGHVLPARLCDVVLVGLLRGLLGVRAAYGTAAVLLAKLMDLLVVGLVVALAVADGSQSQVLPVAAAGILVCALAGLVFLRRVIVLARRMTGGFISKRPRLDRFVTDLAGAAGMWQERPWRTLAAAGVSIAIMLSKLLMFVELVSAIHLFALPVWKIFFAGAVTDLIMALPIQGLFSLGVTEAGWAAGLSMVRVGGETAVVSGFSVHLLWMAMAVSLMLLSLPALPLVMKERPTCQGP